MYYFYKQLSDSPISEP